MSCITDRAKPVFWSCGNNPDYFTAWINTPLGEMWPNSGSCTILFWHLAQWQCTSNPEMNFSANPDYYTTHPPQRHPIQLGSEIWLLSCLPVTTQIRMNKSNKPKVLHTACSQHSYAFGLLFSALSKKSSVISFSCLKSLPQDFEKSESFSFFLSFWRSTKKPLIYFGPYQL